MQSRLGRLIDHSVTDGWVTDGIRIIFKYQTLLVVHDNRFMTRGVGDNRQL